LGRNGSRPSVYACDPTTWGGAESSRLGGDTVADLQTIIAQAGPLPIKVAANVETDAPAVVMVAGSVWSVDQEDMVGFTLSIAGALSLAHARTIWTATATVTASDHRMRRLPSRPASASSRRRTDARKMM